MIAHPAQLVKSAPYRGRRKHRANQRQTRSRRRAKPGRTRRERRCSAMITETVRCFIVNSPFCLAAPKVQRPGQGRAAPKGSLDASRYNGTAQAEAGKHPRRSSPGEPPPERRWGPAGHPNGPRASPEPPAGAAGTGGAQGRAPQLPRQQRRAAGRQWWRRARAETQAAKRLGERSGGSATAAARPERRTPHPKQAGAGARAQPKGPGRPKGGG